MSQKAQPAFRADCSECSMAEESDDFDIVSTFTEKHEKHTDHVVEWTRAEFEDFGDEDYSEWTLTCHICGETWTFSSKANARHHRSEHAEYTDHEIDEEPSRSNMDIPVEPRSAINDAESMKTLIKEFSAYYDEGVPEQAIYASITGDASEIAKARGTLSHLKKRGSVYEPRPGYFRQV